MQYNKSLFNLLQLLHLSIRIVKNLCQWDKSSPEYQCHKESIPQRSQWKKFSRPPIRQMPQASQWYCCFFVCQNTWDEHITFCNTQNSVFSRLLISSRILARNQQSQQRNTIEPTYIIHTSYIKSRFAKRRYQPHHQRICRLNRSIHPCIHHSFRTPAAHLAHDCKASIQPAPDGQDLEHIHAHQSNISCAECLEQRGIC